VPASYHINRQDEFVSLRMTGTVDLVEIYELCRRFLDDPDFNATWPHLVDLRGLVVDVKPGAMRPFANFLLTSYRPKFAGAPMAIVMDADRDADFSAGLYRFTCGLGNAELFDDYAHAMKWLLKNGWSKAGHVPGPPSLKPPDAGRQGADDHPKEIRA
jgi:hypothetical protein